MRQDMLIVYRPKAPPRVTDLELSDLTVYFARDTQRAELPMNDLMWFAIHSTRRVSEICRLEWQDNDDRDLTGLVRDSLLPYDSCSQTPSIQDDEGCMGHHRAAAKIERVHFPL